MKRILYTFFVLFFAGLLVASPQTHVFPALDTNNAFTGTNSFAAISATTVSASGQITSTLATGTSPFSVSSTTLVTNLNSQFLNGKTAPGGNIVGDTDAQTLSAKTLTSPVINGASTGTGVQGTDSKLITSGTVSGTGAALCTDANGGATTSGCPAGAAGFKIENVNTTPVTVANTVTETNLMTWTLAANELGVGQVIRLKGAGVYSFVSSASCTLKLKVDSTVYGSLTLNAGGNTSATNDPWMLDAHIIGVTTGVGGTVEGGAGNILDYVGGATATLNIGAIFGTATVALDTTVSHTIAISATWSAASSSDTIKQRINVAERLN